MGDKNRPMIRMRYIKKKLNCHLEYVLFGFFTFHKFSFSVIKKIMLTLSNVGIAGFFDLSIYY